MLRNAGDPARPIVLVEGGDAMEVTLAGVRQRLDGAGWRLISGLASRPAMARVVLEGRVERDNDAAAAVLAAIDGYGLLLVVQIDGDALHRLTDDLRRLGRVEHVTGGSDGIAQGGPPAPDPDGIRILAMLAVGQTLGEAADALGLSRRTADRRLASARSSLGVRRTTEAIAVAARRGLLSVVPERDA